MSRPRVYETPPIGTTPWPGLLPLRDLDPNDDEDRRAVAYACGKFLVEQGGPSRFSDERRLDAGTRAYRGPRGTMCAWGAFIPDEDYSPRMEGRGVQGTLDFMPIHQGWWVMYLLQTVHDEAAKSDGGAAPVPWSARMLACIDKILRNLDGPERHRERIYLRAMRDGVLDAVLAIPEPATHPSEGVLR